MDQLAAMRHFVRVAEAGSFAAVAQQLGVARSVVTRQVAGLEAHLGCRLIARSTRRLSLTAAGTGYLERCREILSLVDSAEGELAADRQTLRGTIRISLPLGFGRQRAAPLLLDFAREHPEVVLEMECSDRRLNLIEEGIDLAIRVTRQLAPGDVARQLGVAHMKLVAAPVYLSQRGRPQIPADLSGHDYLAYTLSGAALQFEVDGRLQSVALRSRLSANNGDVLLDAAARGMGLTCHPDFLVEDYLADGRLQEILADFAQPALGIYAVLPGNRQLPHRVRVLIDYLARRLAEFR